MNFRWWFPVFHRLIPGVSGSVPCSPPGWMNWTRRSASSGTVSLDGGADRDLRLGGDRPEGKVHATTKGKSRSLARNDFDRHSFGNERAFALYRMDVMPVPESRKRDLSEVMARHGDDDDIGLKHAH